MSVTNSNNYQLYTATGQATFAVPFRFLREEHLEVIVSVAGVESVKTLNVDYTVSGANQYSGGNVVFTTAATPVYGAKVVIRRVMDFTQPVDLRNQGAFFAETHEDVFDGLTMMVQQLKTDTARAVRLPITDLLEGAELSLPTPEVGGVIGWNENGDGLVNYSVGGLFDGQSVVGGYYDTQGNAVSEAQGITLDGGTY
jgi:hypothetical protein